MRCALLLSVSLPLLLGGCNQSSSVLKYEIHGDAVTITGCDEDVSGELVIPNAIKGKPVTSIGGGAFYLCTNITNITIPDGVTSIGEAAFLYCSSLTSITIGNSVTSIGNGAFSDCISLTGITIPDGVTSIGNYAFRDCTRLTSITIPNSVTSIGLGAFAVCKSLTSVTFLGDAPKAGEEVFEEVSPAIYRKPDTKGWGETFGGRPVKLISEKP